MPHKSCQMTMQISEGHYISFLLLGMASKTDFRLKAVRPYPACFSRWLALGAHCPSHPDVVEIDLARCTERDLARHMRCNQLQGARWPDRMWLIPLQLDLGRDGQASRSADAIQETFPGGKRLGFGRQKNYKPDRLLAVLLFKIDEMRSRLSNLCLGYGERLLNPDSHNPSSQSEAVLGSNMSDNDAANNEDQDKTDEGGGGGAAANPDQDTNGGGADNNKDQYTSDGGAATKEDQQLEPEIIMP